MESGGNGVNSARLEAEDYEVLIRRIREVVQAQVPPNSLVAVVSKGDAALVDIAGIRAHHFPQDEQGAHSDTQPADGADAVDQLERLRAGEVEYLVLPSLAFGWLESYPELNEHLMKRYQLVASEDACLVYRLADQAAATAAEAGPPAPDPSVIAPISDLLVHLVPARSAIAVLTLSAGTPVPAGMQPWLFPRAARSDLSLAAGHISALEAGGIEFLVIPGPEREWLELHPQLLSHLRNRHRLVTSQRHLCDVYELEAPRSNDQPEPAEAPARAQQWSEPGRSPVTRLLDMVLRTGADGDAR